MKWYVFYDYGMCNQGDHSCGLDCCDSESEAIARKKEHERNALGRGEPDTKITIIEGTERSV